MKLILHTNSAVETKKIGRILGKLLSAGNVLTLKGELGAGKTTLVKGIAGGLGVKHENAVCSPTFVLIHEYQGREKIYHLDWYRLTRVEGPDAEMAEECFNSSAVTLVEWPERGKKLLPASAWHAVLSHRGPKKRRLVLSIPKAIGSYLLQRLKKK